MRQTRSSNKADLPTNILREKCKMSVFRMVAVVHEGLPAHLRLFARVQPCVNIGVRTENTAFMLMFPL